MRIPPNLEDCRLQSNRVNDAFESLHAVLSVSLISTPRQKLKMCRRDHSIREAKQQVDATKKFDYLPVKERAGEDWQIVGLLQMGSSVKKLPDDATVGEHMIGLPDANLIGADASIRDFILTLPARQICLTVSGDRIDGLVSWADLQKLPVRAALFGMITGLELSMSHAIRRRFDNDEGWLGKLSDCRRKKVRKKIGMSRENDGEVDALLYTQFSDKSTIVRKGLELGSSKSALKKILRRIQKLRDCVAHANNYAPNREKAVELSHTVLQLLNVREELERYEPRLDRKARRGRGLLTPHQVTRPGKPVNSIGHKRD